MCRMTVMQHFHLVTLLDLTLTLTYHKAHIYTLPSSPLEKSFGKVWFRAVIRPVSVTDKAKIETFDLACDLLKNISNLPQKVLVESFRLPPRLSR